MVILVLKKQIKLGFQKCFGIIKWNKNVRWVLTSDVFDLNVARLEIILFISAQEIIE